ncbi:MAG: methyl-accepting chemotaxis protein [Clostridiaceae bacterium]|nr:methyl-accepting chemotaxis protein [Clostridiaceae bacterium]
MRMKVNNNLNKKGLKAKLLFDFLIVGIVPLIIFAIITSIVIRFYMYNSQVSSLKQISSMATKNIDKWADDNCLIVEEIANSQVVKSGDIGEIQVELKNKQAEDSSVLNLMYTDIEGNIISDAKGSIGENVSSEPYFSNVIKGHSYISDVYFSTQQNIPLIVFSSPVKKENEIVGFIINILKVERIKENIGKMLYSEEGKFITFNKNGDITYHENSEKIMKENIISRSDKMADGAKKALEGNFNSIEFKYDGQKEVAVYNFIPSLNWGTMTTIPRSEVYAVFSRIVIIAMILIVIIVFAIVMLAIYVSNGLVKPISKLAELTKEVSDGNLVNECELDGATEIVSIGNYFNEMIKSLKGLVLSIQDNTDELMNASVTLNDMSSTAEVTSKDIARAMEEIADGSVQQATRADDVLNEVRSLDDKMKELTLELKETNNALEISKKALKHGNEGTKALKDNTEVQMKLVVETVDEVNDLSNSVANVDSIIASISEIAEQTSLLALNASIEAARAGESGKGFAVVAEEVASLAEESRNSTKQIETILNEIRNKANKTTQLMDSIDDGMKLQSSTVEETIQIFKEVTDADNQIAENIASFNVLIEYIKKFSDELLQLIETLASSSEESAAVAEEVTASSVDQINAVEKVKGAADVILGIADELMQNIEKFKTE